MAGRSVTRGSYFAPRFFVEIDGKSFKDVMKYVMTFEFTDNDKRSDELVLGISNVGLRWQDDLRFSGGTRLKCRWGYPGDVSDTRQMIISNVTVSNPENGVPALSLQAMDIRHTLNKTAHPKNWGPISSSAVAQQIARRYGLSTDVADSGDARKESRTQGCDTSDMQYLMALAEKLHWDCYVEGGKLHFHPKRLQARPEFEFEYFTDGSGTLLSVDADLNLKRAKKQGAVSADSKTGESANASGTSGPYTGGYSIDNDDGTGQVVGSPQVSQDGNQQPLSSQARAPNASSPLMCSIPESDAKVTTLHAKARQAREELKALTANMHVVGTPKLRARSMVKLTGIGQAYSGVWRIKSARHVINQTSYSLTCELARNALSKGKKDSKKDGNNQGAGTKDPNTSVVILTDTGGFKPFSFSQ
jgi:Bacteriophage probable baseplate hub protein